MPLSNREIELQSFMVHMQQISFSIPTYIILLLSRVFAIGLGDLGSILGRVIPKTLKMVLDNSSLNTQQYKVRIKVEQSMERSCALPYTSV